MDPTGTADSATWAALALTLTMVGAVVSWVALRRRGAAAGLRGLAWTLLPVAAWLTGTLRLAVAIVEDVARWATRLVLSPTVWAGIVVAGVAVLLLVVSGAMRARGVGVRGRSAAARRTARREGPAQVDAGSEPRRATAKARSTGGRHESDLDDMDDIEAILKRHGI